MKRKFTLIELIIVIVVIGILAAMALPKFNGVVRNAKLSAMINDTEVLEKTMVLYYQKYDKLPILNKDEELIVLNNNISLVKLVQAEEAQNDDMKTIYTSLQETLKHYNDDEESLYKIDISKVKDNLSKKLKYGTKKEDKDFYVYSTKTNNVYYYNIMLNGENTIQHNEYDTKLKESELVEINASEFKLEKSSNQEETSFIEEDWSKPLFDSDLNTGVGISFYGSYILTWNGDLSNNIIEIYASSGFERPYATFLDENNEPINSYNLTNKNYYSSHILQSNNTEVQLVVPSNAKKLKLTRGNNEYGSVTEIKILKGPKSKITNINSTIGQYNVLLNYTTDSNFKKVVAFCDGFYVGESSENQIDIQRLCSNSNYHIQLFVLSKNNTTNGIYNYFVKTEDDDVGFFVAKKNDAYYNLIDRDTTNYVYLLYDSIKPEIQFNKELGGKQLVMNLKKYYEYLTIQFYDDKNILIESNTVLRDLIETTKEVTIPKGSKKVRFVGGAMECYISEISIK